MHQSLQGATFHLEHTVPRTQGGASDLDNLALACPSCNLHKADRTELPSPDAEGIVGMFNPRRDVWSEHFKWDEHAIIGKTTKGRATVDALLLNHHRRLKIRQAEQMFGLFPPE